MAVNLNPRTRKKWRDKGYYVEVTESINRVPGGIVRRNDLFGFVDAVAIPINDPDEPWVYLQITSRSNISGRYRKIQGETTGSGQWATKMADLARAILAKGDRIIIEGWDKRKGRYRCKEKELSLDDIPVKST